ncbi:phosphoenolpyruvate-protein phosphotransferase-like isoform X2 [Dermacentor albipictus]|uniref:phosphoenolpyruvate-protein phosphotransferase-like isoform X2 n=1 Tax=Dermacentor albipictus TaxID=60249 RepID=UPI0038FD3E3D
MFFTPVLFVPTLWQMSTSSRANGSPTATQIFWTVSKGSPSSGTPLISRLFALSATQKPMDRAEQECTCTEKCLKGEILVTTATNTGWTPYFPLLAGVVTEIGGPLCHGAIVAREYGLPCVVGIEGITTMIGTVDFHLPVIFFSWMETRVF